jgi:cytidylate kinase
MIVTIDGPAGAGKSSAARALAHRLGFYFLDTGAMYRAVTLIGLRTGCDLSDKLAASSLLANFRLEMPQDQVIVNGEDITEPIRATEVTAAAWSRCKDNSPRAATSSVREEIREPLCFQMRAASFSCLRNHENALAAGSANWHTVAKS